MARGGKKRELHRVNVMLDEESAAKLRRLAGRTHANEGALAGSLLATALDGVEPDPSNVAELLDGIDGAFERALVGLEQARGGLVMPLEEM